MAAAIVVLGAVALAIAAVVDPVGPVSLATVAYGFAVARWANNRLAIAGALGAAAALVITAAGGEAPVPLALLLLAVFAVGRAIREHAVVRSRLAARADELETEREAYAQLSVRYERARIAAELHDIVAHAITVMVVQAAAGQRLAATNPELTAGAFAAIGGAARQAEEDLSRLVELLAGEVAIGEAPDLRLVEDLVQRAAATGLDIRLEVAGHRDGLPAGVVEAAYRVVQESVTNALRYAAGSTVRVSVRGAPAELVVEISNGGATASPPTAPQGTGNGLRGLRERLGALGGTLDAGPTGDGGWIVRARMPRRLAARA